ncbi:class I SAM-dependent methyltransferase, partial [Okeania sp. SIO2B9]
PDQAIFISNLCKIVQPKYVLETGFATGRSAAVVLSSCSPKTFISLDKNLDYITPFGREMAAILMGKFKDYQIIEGDSNELLNPEFYQTNYSSGLDWFTVDGDHSYQGCLHDLESSLRFLNPQGIVIVDDYKSGPPKGVRCPSVNKAVRDFCSRYPEVHKLEWHNNGKGLAILSKSAKQLEIIANLLQLKQPQK